ncbi:MAG: hypothetical protein AAGH90_06565 [Pseudomonadota bacterium]
MIRDWREQHRIIEHSLQTLAKFDRTSFAKNPSGFEATEFPLLIEDMQQALSALKASCITMEQAETGADIGPTIMAAVSGSRRG